MSVQLYSFEEIAKHNTRNDLYMVIDKKVYDITKFLDEVSLSSSFRVQQGLNCAFCQASRW
jgi:predicted heme/steroid binding protein